MSTEYESVFQIWLIYQKYHILLSHHLQLTEKTQQRTFINICWILLNKQGLKENSAHFQLETYLAWLFSGVWCPDSPWIASSQFMWCLSPRYAGDITPTRGAHRDNTRAREVPWFYSFSSFSNVRYTYFISRRLQYRSITIQTLSKDYGKTLQRRRRGHGTLP